jgi:hypothetical protein
MVLSTMKSRHPAMFARSARGVSETPACLGRRLWLAKGASQKPLQGSEHAARNDLMILKVVALIWNSNTADSR